MEKAIFMVECHVDGHTYVISTDGSKESLDIESNKLVDTLYRWTGEEGPLSLEDVCDMLEVFCELKTEHEVKRILNAPRFSSNPT